MIAVAALVWQAAAAPPQTKCDRYADSVLATAAERGAAAFGFARRLRRECWGQFEPLYRAGRAINHVTRYEHVRDDLPLRDEAERLLGRATLLRPRHAGAWLELGVAVKKRGGLQLEAFRAVARAFLLADQIPESTPPEVMAAVDFQHGRYLQNWIDNRRWLKDETQIPLMSPACSSLGAFCENFAHPAAFNAGLRGAPRIAIDIEPYRREVLRLFARTLQRDAAKVEAAERAGRELALGEEWEALAHYGAGQAAAGREPAFFQAVAAMALERAGDLAAAESLFRATIPALPDSIRRWYVVPPKGLDSVSDFWRRARPLWLAPFNELEVEYWTRATYALLVLRDREADVTGPETPQGDVLIRYGFPAMTTQIEGDASRVESPARMDALIAEYLDCTMPLPGGGGGPAIATPRSVGNVGLPPCGSTGNAGYTHDFTIGRWLFWTYRPEEPSLIFELKAGMRVLRHMADAASEAYAIEMRARDPMTFQSRLAPRGFTLPLQVARFRGDTPSRTDVLFASILPASLMDLPPDDTLQVGWFLFRDTAAFPLLRRSVAGHVPGQALALDQRARLDPGRYYYSLEAYAPALGAAAKARDYLQARVWEPDSLLLSDIVVAHRLEPRTVGEPLTWQDVTIEPSRTLDVTAGSTLWLLWETYGLPAGADRLARSQVRLTARGLQGRDLPVRVLEGLDKRRRVGPGVSLEWESERHLALDGRCLDYVALELPVEASGRYEVTIAVTDPGSGRTARSVRIIAVTNPATRP